MSSGTITAGTRITSQLTGTPNGAGTYAVNQSQNQSSATIRQIEQGTYATFISIGGGTAVDQQPRAITSSNASENTLSVGFSYFVNGDKVLFNSLTGGSPLATETEYYVVNSVGNNFQLAETPNGTPIDFTTITSGVIGRITYGGGGYIINNTIKGAYAEGTPSNPNTANAFVEQSMGIVAGGLYDTLYVLNNQISNICLGIHGDSWNNGCLYVDKNYFRNCQRCISVAMGVGGGVGSLGVRRRLEYLRVSNNVFRVSGNAFLGGVAGRFSYVDNILIDGNYIDTYDGTTGAELGFFVSNADSIAITNNVFHEKIAIDTSIISSEVKSIFAKNNIDQNGLQRYEYNGNDRSCFVFGNKTALQNGLELGRAIAIAKSATPFGSAKSSTNKFTVYVNSGEYDLSGNNLNSSEMIFNGPDNISIVGLSEKRDIIIYHSGATTCGISSDSSGITFKNMTIRAANGRVALDQSNNTTCLFDNIVFDKVGTGVIVPSGSSSHIGTFQNCLCEFLFLGSNGQGVFGGKCYNCQWLGGFSSQQASGTTPLFRDCDIVGGIYGAGGGSAPSGVTMKNCRISAPSGTANQDIFINANCSILDCTLKNTRIVLRGSGNEIYNSTFDVDSAQSNCIAEDSGQTGAVKIFNVGSNKPIDTNLTITALDLLVP